MIQSIIIVSTPPMNPPLPSWGGPPDQSVENSWENSCSHHCNHYESLAVSAYSRIGLVLKGDLG